MISQAEQHAHIAEHIRRFGWHCLNVHPNRSDQRLFTYSIGFFETYQSPEVLVFGPDAKKSHALLSECASLLASGAQLEFDTPDDRILVDPYKVVFRRVKDSALGYYFGTALRYYGRDQIPAAIMLLPDRENRIPGDAAYDGMDQSEALSII